MIKDGVIERITERIIEQHVRPAERSAEPSGNTLCVAAMAASLSTAGAKSPAVFFSEENAVDRYERLTWEVMELRLVGYRRLLRESREREIDARLRTDVLEKCLADMHANNGTHRCVSAVLAVALVFAVFALLA